MSHYKLARTLDMADDLAAAIYQGCVVTLKHGPRTQQHVHPTDIFNWYVGKPENGCKNWMVTTPAGDNDEIPCWTITELHADDEKVKRLSTGIVEDDVVLNSLIEWRRSLNQCDSEIVPIQYYGTAALIGGLLGSAKSLNAEVYDNSGDGVVDIQFHVVVGLESGHYLVCIEPNLYTSTEFKMVPDNLN